MWFCSLVRRCSTLPFETRYILKEEFYKRLELLYYSLMERPLYVLKNDTFPSPFILSSVPATKMPNTVGDA